MKKFWYNAVSEFCNFSEFRSQLENEPSVVKFIKKAIYEADLNYADQLIFGVRVLCQSKPLLENLIDDLTVPVLFDLYRDYLRFASKDVVIYMLQTTNLLCQSPHSRINVLRNQTIVDILMLCLQKEDVDIANEAARVLVNLLEYIPSNFKLSVLSG